jgi:site-specific DNA-methyltransferase (adenine-specific)
MLKHIITSSSKAGDSIFDCFAGSGNTGKAAKDLDRNCILIEKDKEWVERINIALN